MTENREREREREGERERAKVDERRNSTVAFSNDLVR